MSRPRNADGQRTRQAILDAALHLFADKGFFGTSLRDVAAAVGVRESALYNYFSGKDALFDALLATEREEKDEQLGALAEAPVTGARAVLEQCALAMVETFRRPRQQQLFRILMSDGIRLTRSGRINLAEKMGSGGRGPVTELLARLIRDRHLRDGDVHMMAIAFVSPLLLWRQLFAINADMPMVQDADTFVRQHVDQFLRGAAPQPAVRTARPRARSRTTPARTSAPRRRRLA